MSDGSARAIPLAAVRTAFAQGAWHAVAKLCAGRPVPLRLAHALRAAAGTRDALLPGWAADAHAMSEVDLEILSRYLRRLKPSYVLELGCGESTIRTARALAEIHGDAVTRLLTVEQDRRFAELCSARLAAEGLNATVVHRPLVSQPIPGGDTQSYDLDALDVGAAPDLIVIDGPSGGRLVRYPVLPGIRRYLAHPTPFLLHDGLRDYELLRVAGAWQQIAGIRVGGVYAGGEGFLTGTVTP